MGFLVTIINIPDIIDNTVIISKKPNEKPLNVSVIR
jgi:hypothetical protein